MMISRVFPFLLRPRNVAPLTRSRALCIPAVAARTRATNARMSIQDMRTWHLTVASIGLFGTVLLSPLTLIFFFSSYYWTYLILIYGDCTLRVRCRPFLEKYWYQKVIAAIPLSFVFSKTMMLPFTSRFKPYMSLLTPYLSIGYHPCCFQSTSS